MKPEVALVACRQYDQAEVDLAVDKAISILGGAGRFVKPGNRVLLKVNLLASASPEDAVTTHPAVVRAVIREVRAAGGVPAVGDCSGWEGPPNRSRYLSVLGKAGIRRVCEEEGVEILHLSESAVVVDSPEGRAFRHFTIAKAVLEADVVVNLPKLKTHSLTLYTGAVKNVFGCIPGLHKAQFHWRARNAETFAQMLVDLLLAVRPAMTLMDAVVGMEGNGPRSGRPRHVGAIVAGADPVAVDAVSCSLVGLDPLSVPVLRLADQQARGVARLAGIEVRGQTPEVMRVPSFRLPDSYGRPAPAFALADRLLRNRLVARPEFIADRCRACWACVEACPAGALHKDTKAPKLDREQCIYCYCCQELCPHDAVALRRPLLSRLMTR